MIKNDNYNVAIDLINVLSLILGIENLNANNEQIKSLEEHLNKQDEQYNKIISLLEELKLQLEGGNYERRKETK